MQHIIPGKRRDIRIARADEIVGAALHRLMVFRALVRERKRMRPVGNRVADIMPARTFRIAVLCAVEIHADAQDIVSLKYLIDADGRILLELSRILKPRIVHRDRAVEILPAFYCENHVRPLRLIGREELDGDIL